MRADIVVIEDDPDVRLLIMTFLANYNVIAFGDVAEAKMYQGWANAHLALIDWMLPGEDGGFLAVWLEENHPHVTRVCMTALADEDLSVVTGVDVDLFHLTMPKPFSVLRLQEVVETYGRG